MKLMNIMEALDKTCPFSMQEGFDNSGLQVGDTEKDCQKILLAFDFTEEVLEEAIAVRADVIITHHPFLFTPLKSISTAHWKGRQIFRLIRENIALVALHTNLDKDLQFGVSKALAERLCLQGSQVLLPGRKRLRFRMYRQFVPSHALYRFCGICQESPRAACCQICRQKK